MSYILQQSAFLTAVLHSIRFPQYAVFGLLLGKSGSQPNATTDDDRNKGSAESASDSPVVLEDALPLFHTSAVLLPMLELALMQVGTCIHACACDWRTASKFSTRRRVYSHQGNKRLTEFPLLIASALAQCMVFWFIAPYAMAHPSSSVNLRHLLPDMKCLACTCFIMA